MSPMLLNKIERVESERVIRLDIGRTLAITVIGLTAIVGAVILWSNDHNGAAFALFQFGQAIVVGGLGIAIGERRGAAAAEEDS